MGLHRAGYDVTGVDINPQPHYPFTFIQADAVRFDIHGEYDLVWASPPCQYYCAFSRNLGTADNHPDLVPVMRAKLSPLKCPTIMENVVGAPLRNALMLCGTMFGLPLIRHRLFEMTNFRVDFPPADCGHTGDEIPVYGNGTSVWHLEKRNGVGVSLKEKKAAMGIDWMTGSELKEAIPPAYSEFLARQI